MAVRTLIAALAIVAATSVAYGRDEPLVEPGRIALTAADGKPRGAADVRAMIIAGGRKLGWSVDADIPGKLTLQHSKGSKHEVVVDAVYDNQGYELKYVSSVNMNYSKAEDGKAEIHPTYNRWVANLIAAIGSASATPVSASVASGAILLQMPAATSDDLANSKIGTECQLGRVVAGHVSKAMSSSYPRLREVEQIDSVPAGERGLKLTIVSTTGVGGGSFSGPKSITLRGDLVDSQGVVATRTFVRRSGVTGPLFTWRTTCDLFERAAVTLGKDVARWVANPSVAIADDSDAPVPEAAASSTQQHQLSKESR